jgi:hypothetical protein
MIMPKLSVMDYLINQEFESDDTYHVSLQASQAGLHLYETLGFKALGKLTSLAIKQ